MNQRAFFGPVVLALLFASAPARLSLSTPLGVAFAARASAKASTPPVTIPFELVNRHIILKIRVNNSRVLSFVLDTGDRFALIDLDRAKELKLDLGNEVRVGGAGALVLTGATVQNASFTLPGLEGFSQPVTLAFPFGELSARAGMDFDGIIGAEFIKQFVIEVDYPAHVLRLHDKASFVYDGPGESLPIQLNSGGHPIVDAEVTPNGGEPIKGKFVLDLGSGAALALYSPFVAAHHLPGAGIKTIKAIGGAGAGGAITGQIGRVSELKLGRFRIVNPITLFSEDKAGAFAMSSLAGNIGARVADKFKVFLDYSHNRVILEPNSTFASPYDRAFSGFSLQAEGKDYRTFRITEVLPNSPGSEIGLQKGDLITSVNGRPATSLTLNELNDMFERTTAAMLSIRRGDQTLQVTLTPRRLV